MQNVILDMVNRFGYVGVLILIAVENVFPPIPSEVILTFGGFLTTCTRLHPAGVVLSSTAGSLLGALVLYGAGTLVSPESLSELLDSRPMKLLGFHAEDAWKTITWFQKKGQRAVLFGRCIPIIRSLISVPAGMARMEMPKHGVEHSSRRNRCCGRCGVGAGGGICEDVCRYRFSRAGSRSGMLCGGAFI